MDSAADVSSAVHAVSGGSRPIHTPIASSPFLAIWDSRPRLPVGVPFAVDAAGEDRIEERGGLGERLVEVRVDCHFAASRR
jgi:hypothetical protein